MSKAMRIHETGGPDAMRWEDAPPPAPGAGEVLVRNAAIGLNFIDTYFRAGRYPAPLPFVPGNEGAGTIEAIGPDVTGFVVGDRVGYVGPLGAYAERLVRPAARLIPLPDGIDDVTAAAIMLKGITAEYLVRRTYQVARGDTILVHAAAGGVGQILCQWAAHLGATVIGTVGSAAKRAIAESCGCARVVVTSEEDFALVAREMTGGEGVAVAYDGVGKDSFEGSLRSVRVRGLVVAFGAASGAIPPFDLQRLSGLGSLYVTRPTMDTYTRTTEELRASAAAIFDMVGSGTVRIAPPTTYRLADAVQAHHDLEGRRTTGSVVLLA